MAISNVQISESTLGLIKAGIGYPLITDEFSHIMTDDQIKANIIAPALEIFYQYFPIVEEIQYVSTGANNIATYDAPEKCVGLIKQQFVPQSSTVAGANLMQQGIFYNNPFYTASQVISKGSYGMSGSFGSPFGYGKELYIYQNRFYNESVEAMNKVYYIHYNEQTNKVDVKASIPGTFNIGYGLFDENVDNIPTLRRQAFIKYTKGQLKLSFAEILGLTESDLPVSLNVDKLQDDGEKLVEESLTYFREASTFPIMR